jgi:hypothetical protein
MRLVYTGRACPAHTGWHTAFQRFLIAALERFIGPAGPSRPALVTDVAACSVRPP